MNSFQQLCLLASEEDWCWKIVCTTCGHLHFRYSFAELAKGKSPGGQDWLIFSSITSYSKTLGKVPFRFSDNQKQSVLKICLDADLSFIADNCRFPDWLGYLGLVIYHTFGDFADDKNLSVDWASQLKKIVSLYSESYKIMDSIILDEQRLLSLKDLESCETDLMRVGK